MAKTLKCPRCGGVTFVGHQRISADVLVDGNGEFVGNLPGGLEPNIYYSERPFGPFECTKCGTEVDFV